MRYISGQAKPVVLCCIVFCCDVLSWFWLVLFGLVIMLCLFSVRLALCSVGLVGVILVLISLG